MYLKYFILNQFATVFRVQIKRKSVGSDICAKLQNRNMENQKSQEISQTSVDFTETNIVF